MSARMSLVRADLESGMDQRRGESQMPPSWADGLEEVQYMMTRLRTKLKDIEALHTRHLHRPTLDDSSEEETQIEALTQEISRVSMNLCLLTCIADASLLNSIFEYREPCLVCVFVHSRRLSAFQTIWLLTLTLFILDSVLFILYNPQLFGVQKEVHFYSTRAAGALSKAQTSVIFGSKCRKRILRDLRYYGFGTAEGPTNTFNL